jgi:antitoxin (DNA-binding transcriptional repressor) of toxin-antitoxin stability system
MEASLDYAQLHFQQLLRRVVGGEEVLLREGGRAVAKIIPFESSAGVSTRPRVGEITSEPVRWCSDSFAALDEDGMKALGLL